ncbi:MAG TPA: YMGG-like glycine zipper-containing protein [Paracoccus sp. (in: a-proteobacteria)]|uniref:YMGG-like glycine zipper-containing protein n=1 Tax=uncultured Paracoccus sp. TaxID=189685 RepID=UPI002607EF9F|nr:YMGG-like glycine zipper-containing protein [uncultured Paracoccus sp.]HMQ40599.1 YMGG-like glycine zipper-containing protein [Paracoccus sp. (in: a-proteobacteria)]HMR36520.1 YMGG-like glycine zipper-containing protein [Paracoccus sp. (in: a-proteobacteria)]
MSKLHIPVTAVLFALGLAGCTQNINPTDIDRAAIGAAAGATIAHVADKDESDVYKGAAIGAAAGALCNDVRLCQ